MWHTLFEWLMIVVGAGSLLLAWLAALVQFVLKVRSRLTKETSRKG